MGPISVIDSHTEGEPTRVVISGLPPFETKTMADRRAEFAAKFDAYRRLIVLEPRGYDAIVGALITPPEHPDSHLGVIFFNDVGYLGMCGHGTIGLVHTLVRHPEIAEHHPTNGVFRIDTPEGTVRAIRRSDGYVEVSNVLSYTDRLDVTVGDVTGDIAYGGNWFFITPAKTPIQRENLAALMTESKAIRTTLRAEGLRGRDGHEIDHIELTDGQKVFVLCPGEAWDRSPCGTGTSAKMATLAARGKLAPGAIWEQESIVGGKFFGSYEPAEGGIHPRVWGRAYITGRADLFMEKDDFLHP